MLKWLQGQTERIKPYFLFYMFTLNTASEHLCSNTLPTAVIKVLQGVTVVHLAQMLTSLEPQSSCEHRHEITPGVIGPALTDAH